MSDLKNTALCPEDELRVLLPAEKIPDGATVAKRTGEQQFTLVHNLKVYKYGGGKSAATQEEKPLEISGFFIISSVSGAISQVQPDTMLHWVVPLEEFYEVCRESVEGSEQ